MKKLLLWSAAAFTLAGYSLPSTAETQTFEINYPSTNAQPLYPNLNLNSVSSIKLVVDRNQQNPEGSIRRLDIDFENATDLTVTNFSREYDRHVATINGAWVYRKLGVELVSNGPISENSDINIRLYVIEMDSVLNSPGETFGPDILTVNGPLMNTSPNPIADVTSMVVNGKRLTLRLLKRPESGMNGEGFVVNAQWLGNGDRTLYLNTPIAPPEYANFVAVGFNLESVTLPDGNVDYQIQVRYEDQWGTSFVNGFEPLKPLLDMVYPPQP